MTSANDTTTAAPGLEAYTAQLTGSDAAVLGFVVLYSVFGGEVTPDQVKAWFLELRLDQSLLPDQLRPVDAFEKVTGPDGLRVSYSLADPSAVRQRGEYTRRKAGEFDQVATLMVRPVRVDGQQMVRHLVREVRDEGAKALKYDSRLAEVIFHKDGSTPGGGRLQVVPDNAEIGALPVAEQERIRESLAELSRMFQWHCTYLGPDRLRGIVRRYIEMLKGIPVRKGGGVYFVTADHTRVLAALTTFIGRVGEKSHFVQIPLPDAVEMRELVISAFTTKARDEANKLAMDIAAAARKGDANAAYTLHRRFTALKQSAAQYQDLLSNSLDEAGTALDLVQLQLASLLSKADGGVEPRGAADAAQD
ncbi:DUF6744 family protein [Nocardia takedensis]|uniref:DUF6744 family protein n=1 Tax=Nocardia takedensis TaxID=259390 RepID=UPI003F76CB5F